MITVKINKQAETVTYSTLIYVDNKFISLTRTTLLYYAKPYHLNHSLLTPGVDLFEELFNWTKECYTNPKLHHLAYFRMTQETEANDEAKEFAKRCGRKGFIPYFNHSAKPYESSKKLYEVEWEEIIVEFDTIYHKIFKLLNDSENHATLSRELELNCNMTLRLTNSRGAWHVVAIPPNGTETRRIDCYKSDNSYHYDCNPGEHEGVFIVLEPRDVKIFVRSSINAI